MPLVRVNRDSRLSCQPSTRTFSSATCGQADTWTRTARRLG